MGKELLILDFKLVTEPSGRKKVYLLEAGLGLMSILPKPLEMALNSKMAEFYPHKKIFVDEKYPSMYADLLAGKLKEPCVLFFEEKQQAQHADFHIRKHKLNHIEVCHANSIFYTNDKAFFAAICKQNDLPIPDTWICSPNTMTPQRLEAIKRACPQGVIIKPVALSCGEGVAFVEVDQLEAVVKWLNGETRKNPLANEGRFMDGWRKEEIGNTLFVIQRCIVTAETGHEPTFRVVFSINDDKIDIIGLAEKYSFDAVKKGEKRTSKTIVSCTTLAAEKYHLQEKKSRILDKKTSEYENIAALMLPIIKKLASITPEINPIKVCIDEYRKDKSENMDYIYFLLPYVTNKCYAEFNSDQISLMKECLMEQFDNIEQLDKNIDALMQIFLAGYFTKGRDANIPQYARTEAFFQFIVFMLMHSQSKESFCAIKERAVFSLENDRFLDPQDRMSAETCRKTEALVTALTALIESKPYPNIPCLFGPYSDFLLSNGEHRLDTKASQAVLKH